MDERQFLDEALRRYEERVIRRAGDECWGWTGATQKGKDWGVVWVRGSTFKAYRLSWLLHCGEIPEGHEVKRGRACVDRACTNPRHLRLRKFGSSGPPVDMEAAWAAALEAQKKS